MTSQASIQEFLSQKRFAMVGVSRNSRDFTRMLFREFLQRGYQVVPVHPEVEQIEGQDCCKRIQDIVPQVEAVLLCVPPAVTDVVVRDCAAAGVRSVWMYRGGTNGAVSQPAIEFCRSNSIAVIEGECPFMFLPHAGAIHRFHGFVKKICGTYPR